MSKKAYTALLQCRTFLCRQKCGPQTRDFGGRYGFLPGFHRVFVSTTDLESFSLRPEKFPKRFSFGGGRVRFFLLLKWVKSRDSYHRIASENYRYDSNRKSSLVVISPSKTQKLVLTDPAFIVLRFESRDWRSFV